MDNELYRKPRPYESGFTKTISVLLMCVLGVVIVIGAYFNYQALVLDIFRGAQTYYETDAVYQTSLYTLCLLCRQ